MSTQNAEKKSNIGRCFHLDDGSYAMITGTPDSIMGQLQETYSYYPAIVADPVNVKYDPGYPVSDLLRDDRLYYIPDLYTFGIPPEFNPFPHQIPYEEISREEFEYRFNECIGFLKSHLFSNLEKEVAR